MRRISLALALMGAVAAAGCGGGAKPSSSTAAKGTAGSTFTVTVAPQGTGTVVSGTLAADGVTFTADGKISCPGTCSADYAWGTTGLALQATTTQFFNGWAGDCWGTGFCQLSGNAEKYVVASFSATPQSHPNFNDPKLHAVAFIQGQLQCTQCHGSSYQGQGIAPACNACHTSGGHDWPITSFTSNYAAPAVGPHFDPTAAAWGTHSGSNWAQACQRCHTNQGYQDYVGALAAPGESAPSADYLTGTFLITNTLTTDTAAGAYTHGPLQCQTCHNSVTDPLGAGISQVMFPSGYIATADKVTALCAQCHEARESTVSMNTLIGAVTADAQINAAGVSFKNPHYRGAAATLYGSLAQGWAQYPNQVYTGQNQHGGAASCTVCHNAHTGEVEVAANTCGKCHFKADGSPVASMADLKANRQYGFEGDIDGDGVVAPLDVEIAGLQAKLLAAIQQYAVDVAGQPGICFSDATYPYFLKHTGASGDCTATELTAAAAYKAFTPRLMRAAYNLKFSATEFGAWAHNPRYAVELLWDGITDLNAGLVAAGKTPVAFSGKRSFNGHFGAADAADRYAAFLYDAAAGQPVGTGFTSAACYQCHGGQGGFAQYLADPTGATMTMTNKVTGMQCTTCHAATGADMKSFRTDITAIYLPPQKAATNNPVSFSASTLFSKPADRVCATCHTGRENKTSIDLKIGATADTSWTLGFVNPHYLGAVGVMLASNAHMMYEYVGKTYASYPAFWQTNGTANGPYGSPHAQSCSSCHNAKATEHSFEVDTATSVPAGTYQGKVNTATCDTCHVASSHGDFRLPPLKTNIAALSDLLYSTIQSYASARQAAGDTGAKPLCYCGTYPYWYDATATSNCTANLVSANGAKLNPAASRAAFNYKWSKAEPGAYAHNYEYMAQTLIDSILDLNPSATLPVDAKTGATIVRP